MFDCQQALIRHLSLKFEPAAIKTIKQYAGEIQDADNLAQLMPAVLVNYQDGSPMAQDPLHNFDLLVITQSVTLQKSQSKDTGLQLSSLVINYLRDNSVFTKIGGGGTYAIKTEGVQAGLIAMDNSRFHIIDVSLPIMDHTHDLT